MPSNNSQRVDLFDRERVRIAREAKGWTKQKLADAIDVSPAAVSQYENGASKPTSAVLGRMSLALGMPRGFFLPGRPRVLADSGSAHFRSLRSTTLRDRKRALTYATFAWELTNHLERYVKLPVPSFPHAVLPEKVRRDDLENLAAEARQLLNIGDGPVPNVTRLLESKGAVIVRLPVACHEVDAFSCVLKGRPIVLLSSDKEDKARSRHDASHELGHLIAHDDVDPGSQTVERQADAFAAAFLMPADEIGPALPARLDWSRLINLRLHWGVSIASLLVRARTLGIISEHTYRRGFTTLNTKRHPDGVPWRRREPGDLGRPEQPSMLAMAIDILHGDNISTEHLANELSVPVDLVEQLVGGDSRPEISF